MIDVSWLKAANIDAKWKDLLDASCLKHYINNPKRIAAFLAQTSHESNGYTRLVENLNYSAEGLEKYFSKYFTRGTAKIYARRPEAIANIVYFGRYGNTEPGDGWKYRARGIIGITFKDNYARIGGKMNLDLVKEPELLDQPEHAVESACVFWDEKGLNGLADTDMFETITRRINGGLNGHALRVQLWNEIKTAMHL